MRFMVIVKATAESEKEGALPDPQLMADMGKYNEELIKAGIQLVLRARQPVQQEERGDAQVAVPSAAVTSGSTGRASLSPGYAMASSTACAPSLSGCSLRRHSSEIRTGLNKGVG